MTWSRMDWESRMPPAARRAMAVRACCVGGDAVSLDDAGQLGGDDVLGDRMELEALAAGGDGRQDFVGLGRRG
jgi:hypothetical protein